MKSPIIPSVAANLDAKVLQATLPLLAAEKVGAIEWTFDALFSLDQVPDWFLEFLQVYAQAGRLLGHGIFFSLFQGRWTQEQADWLERLRKISQELPFDHVTEHFGFMTGENFHAGAPLGVPLTKRTLQLGQDRLARIQDTAQCPVGLENLAIAYSLYEVQSQGDFLNRLLEPVNGFIILDLHNLYCQIHNFSVNAEELLASYPLERVREIHISGGSWVSSAARLEAVIRRDTHDDAVPEAVFELLARAIPKCPHLKYVTLEQIGEGLQSAAKLAQFQSDFDTMCTVIEQANADVRSTSFLPSAPLVTTSSPVTDDDLYQEQQLLSSILETAADYPSARQRLQASPLAHTAWQVEQWDDAMLDTALQIAQKWRNVSAKPGFF